MRRAVNQAELERVAGTYLLDSDLSTRVVVTPSGNHLSLTLIQATGRSTVEYLPAGPGLYFRQDIDLELQFSNETPAKTVTLIQDGERFAASRTNR